MDAISFWPTHNPFYGLSYRYAFGRLNHIGIKNWKGREVDLRASRQQKTESKNQPEVRMPEAEASAKGI